MYVLGSAAELSIQDSISDYIFLSRHVVWFLLRNASLAYLKQGMQQPSNMHAYGCGCAPQSITLASLSLHENVLRHLLISDVCATCAHTNLFAEP